MTGPARARIRRLRRDETAVAMIEFAFCMPILFGFGMYGVEVANLAIANMKMSQIALTLADNASRLSQNTPLAQKQVRESDINDVFQGARLQAQGFDLGTRGRVTLSQLQVNDKGGQQIKWQRCLGMRRETEYQSHHGAEGDGANGTGTLSDSFRGMGPADDPIVAPPGTAVMFVELNYEFRPLLAEWLVPARRLHYTASFIVRDRRDLTAIHNPTPTATPMLCDQYTG